MPNEITTNILRIHELETKKKQKLLANQVELERIKDKQREACVAANALYRQRPSTMR